MKKKRAFNLLRALHELFDFRENEKEKTTAIYLEILKQTGLTGSEFDRLACQDQTYMQLAYRIYGLMDKKKLDTSHLYTRS